MARFLGAIQGRKGAVTRLGDGNSGIRAQAQGWNAGVTVHGGPVTLGSDQDAFVVTLTGGSNNERFAFHLGELKQAPSGKRFFHLSDEAIEAIRIGSNVIELDADEYTLDGFTPPKVTC